jgi:hypothetical protein
MTQNDDNQKTTMDSRKTQNDDNQKKQWTVARHRTMTTKKTNGQSQDTER